jgi:hypothetical protein
MKRTFQVVQSIAVVMVLIAAPRLALANKCWFGPFWDADNDGYAVMGASLESFFHVQFSDNLSCPPGWVSKRGDCDDGDSSVHPRRREVRLNGIDDNCNGKIDEPTFNYYLHGNDNTTDGFSMRVRINDQDVLNANGSTVTKLGYKVEYQRLRNTGVTYQTGYQQFSATLFWLVGTQPSVNIGIDGLYAGTAYRARIKFYKRTGRSVPLPVGEWSDWYYTMTDYSYSLGKARTDVVLRALKEFYRSEVLGSRGYLAPSYQDGTRYTASVAEHWCSEFYSWVVDKEFDLGQHATANSIVDAFEDEHVSAYQNGSGYYLSNTAMAGDYLAFDWEQNNSLDHSGMFLAYDSHTDQVFTVEGNATGFTQGDSRKGSNEVVIRKRNSSVIDGFGRLSFLDLQ